MNNTEKCVLKALKRLNRNYGVVTSRMVAEEAHTTPEAAHSTLKKLDWCDNKQYAYAVKHDQWVAAK